jgi:hypothetical protein
MASLAVRAVAVMVLVAGALAFGLWVGGHDLVGGSAPRERAVAQPDRASDDEALTAKFFDGHRSFLERSAAIRDAANVEDWAAARSNAALLAADAAAARLAVGRLRPSAPLAPFADAYGDELAAIEATGTTIAAACEGGDPATAVPAALASLDAVADEYDRVYGILQMVA